MLSIPAFTLEPFTNYTFEVKILNFLNYTTVKSFPLYTIGEEYLDVRILDKYYTLQYFRYNQITLRGEITYHNCYDGLNKTTTPVKTVNYAWASTFPNASTLNESIQIPQ